MWKRNTNKIALIARGQINSIKNVISKALIEREISHEDFTAIISKVGNYHKQKESIKMMKNQRWNIENGILIKDGKKRELIKLLSKMKYLIIIYKNIYIKRTK